MTGAPRPAGASRVACRCRRRVSVVCTVILPGPPRFGSYKEMFWLNMNFPKIGVSGSSSWRSVVRRRSCAPWPLRCQALATARRDGRDVHTAPSAVSPWPMRNTPSPLSSRKAEDAPVARADRRHAMSGAAMQSMRRRDEPRGAEVAASVGGACVRDWFGAHGHVQAALVAPHFVLVVAGVCEQQLAGVPRH